jgi:hypothetical protein
MIEFMTSWLPAIGGIGLIGWVALSFFAPSIAGVAGEWLKALSPVIKAIAEGFAEFFRIMYKGLKDVVDNAATVAFVVVVALSSYGLSYYQHSESKEAYHEERLQEFRKTYKFIKRTPEERRRYLRTLNQRGRSTSNGWSFDTLHRKVFGSDN